MAKEEPLYKYGGFVVWPNRVEYTTGTVFKKTETYPIRKISSVEASKLTNKLTIRTDDGKEHTFHVMGVEKARDAILAQM